MTRFLIALAAIATTAAPLLAFDRIAPAPKVQAPATMGSDRPILLMRMVVTATPLPDTPGC